MIPKNRLAFAVTLLSLCMHRHLLHPFAQGVLTPVLYLAEHLLNGLRSGMGFSFAVWLCCGLVLSFTEPVFSAN